MRNFEAYLQHGASGGPYRTESVECIEKPLWWQLKGLSFTASGYGARIPTTFMVRYNGKLRRVYCMQYSNCGTLYIGKRTDNVLVSIDRV